MSTITSVEVLQQPDIKRVEVRVPGTPGAKGWSPHFAEVADGARRVRQLVDWVGGEGTKPAVGLYMGASGLVSNIADAVNVRPADGVDGDDGAAATIAVGTVTTLAAGSNATVVNSGTNNAAVLDLGIPEGETFDDIDVTDVARSDVLIAEVDDNGKILNTIDTQARHRHEHQPATITSGELVDGAKLANVPSVVDAQSDRFSVVFTDANNKRFLAVDQNDKLIGVDPSPLATEALAETRGAPQFATGHITGQRMLTIGSPITQDENYASDGVAGAWKPLPYLAADCFDLTNQSGVALELRRSRVTFDGLRYSGTWNPASGKLPIPGNAYRAKPTWFWHVTNTSGNFVAGDRVVFLGGVDGSTQFATAVQNFVFPDMSGAPDNYAGTFFKVLRGADMRFYRGTWAANSNAYPTDANLVEGDTYSVITAGTIDGVTFAYGDYLVRRGSGWRKERGSAITEVADAASASFMVPSGYLAEWEIRRKTGAAPAYADIEAQMREPVTARVHEIAGRQHIWLHYADGRVNKLPKVNAKGNSFAPSFDGSILTYANDGSGCVQTFRIAAQKMPGKFGFPFSPVKARSDTFLSVGDSYNGRGGVALLAQLKQNDIANGRVKNRNGLVPVDTGSFDQEWIFGLINILAEGGYQADDHLSGIVCYILDWNNGTQEERETIVRAMGALQGLCPRLFVTGNTRQRDVRWNGSAMYVQNEFAGNAAKEDAEARLEEMMGGEFFDGGLYANMGKYITSPRSPRFTATDWDPVLQMSVGEVASRFGIWSVWTVLDIDTDNYALLRANINQANFQSYIDNQSQITSTTDWHYYVGTGVGDTTLGWTYYKLGGATFSFPPGDGVHLPGDGPVVTAPNSDTSNIMNLMAYDVVSELAARGWLD
ncbi:MAG: hypothetical protein AAFO77_00705 [Pseudomonadota bacterium]